MHRKYESDGDVLKLVAAFEDATIARGVWKHAEHLVVALYYSNCYDLETAVAKMRDGLFNLLTDGFKVDLTKEMPYHETLTVFWMRTVHEFARSSNRLPLHEKANSLIEEFDKDYPLKFYSRELLFSDTARSTFIEPEFVSDAT